MANGTDYNIRFKAVDQELKKTFKAVKEMNKSVRKEMDDIRKKQSKHNKEYIKELNSIKELVKSIAKEQANSIKEVSKLSSKERNQEKRFRKDQDRESARSRKREERETLSFFDKLSRRTGGGGPGGGGGRGLGRGMARLGGALTGGLGGLLIGGAISSYQTFVQLQHALSGTIGLDKFGERNVGVARSRAMGRSLGFSSLDTAAHIPVMARATGTLSPRELQQAMRATAMGAGEVGGAFGVLRQAGIGFEGAGPNVESAGGRQFREIMAGAVYSGLEKGRMPEFVQGVTSILQKQSATRAGDLDVGSVNKLLAVFGASGLSGLQGARGANVLSQISSGIMNPGGGEWGQHLVRRAMGFGQAGSGVSYYESEKMREQGLSGDNFQRVMSQFQKEFKGKDERSLAMREVFGTSLSVNEALIDLAEKGDFSKESLAKVSNILKGDEKGGSLEKQSLDAMKENGTHLEHIAGRITDLSEIGEDFKEIVAKLEDVQIETVRKIAPALLRLGEIIQWTLEKALGIIGKDPDDKVKDARKEVGKILKGSYSLAEKKSAISKAQMEEDAAFSEEERVAKSNDAPAADQVIAYDMAILNEKRRKAARKHRLRLKGLALEQAGGGSLSPGAREMLEKIRKDDSLSEEQEAKIFNSLMQQEKISREDFNKAKKELGVPQAAPASPSHSYLEKITSLPPLILELKTMNEARALISRHIFNRGTDGID